MVRVGLGWLGQLGWLERGRLGGRAHGSALAEAETLAKAKLRLISRCGCGRQWLGVVPGWFLLTKLSGGYVCFAWNVVVVLFFA